MKRYLSCIIIALFVMLSLPVNTYAAPSNKGNNSDIANLNCKSALLMEASSGKIIFEQNSHEKLAPASVTKVMTMLLTMEDVDNGRVKLSDKATVSQRAKSMGGSTMCLDVGEIRTVEELLKGVAIESANDAAVALAEFVGGSEEAFVKRMNDRAKELGMKDTNFVNPMGFYDPNHYTSAYDIAIMSKELLKHKKILDYTKIWMETISEGRKSPFTLVNRNKMIKTYNGCDGLKTGFVKEAMYCVSATAMRNNVRFVSVIMGAPSWKERNAMAETLMSYGFAKFESLKLVNKGEVAGELAISKSKPEKVNALCKDDLSVVLEKGAKINIQKKLEISNNLKLPIKKGSNIGVLKAMDGNKVYGQVDVVADQDIVKMRVFDTIKKTFGMWINTK